MESFSLTKHKVLI